MEIKINESINEINLILLDIFKNNNNIKLQPLVNQIENLKNLYFKFKQDFGELSEVQLNKDYLTTLKSFISKLKEKDINIYNMLKEGVFMIFEIWC